MQTSTQIANIEMAPLRPSDITEELVSRWERHSKKSVRQAAAQLRLTVTRHANREYCNAKDLQDIDTANFYLPAGMMIRYAEVSRG